MNSVCPNCDKTVVLSKSIKRDSLLDCPFCGELLRVKNRNPLILDYDLSSYEYDYENEDDAYRYN